MNSQRVLLKLALILCLGLMAMICGYFSLFLRIGIAVVVDPRDILVVLAGVVAGPAGGLIAGLFAGLPGADPLVETPMFIVSGLATGMIARYCLANHSWIPSSALGLGCGYVTAGLVLLGLGWYEDLATFAFRSLIMINLCILILIIIDSLDPGIFLWERRIGQADTPTPVERLDLQIE
jgi:LytS/YehU family sensor histidine kinase